MRELDKVLDEKEKVLWEGKPKFWPFILGGSIVTTIIGLFLMLFMIPFIGFAVYDIIWGSHILGFGIFLIPHFWIGIILVIGIPLYQVFVYKHVYYAITNKRVLLQKGLVGRDFEMTDFDQITNAEVNVGVFDKLFGGSSGSILISTAGSFTYGRHGQQISKPYSLRNIENPYEVFKFFKKISHAVKTDIQYPNKYRPSTNPGYNTKYNPN
jgi:uncharacterized membrane protein YdbT with pleckstrin-like domain